MSREYFFTDQKYLLIKSLQTDYLNLEGISGSGRNNAGSNLVQKKWTFCGGTNHSAEKCFKRIRNDKEIARAAGDSDMQRTEHTPCKCFRYKYLNHLIDKCLKPPKDNEKKQKQVCFN